METRKLRLLVCALAVGLIASLANADITTDLVAHITFDDETADDSAGDNHGAMNGDAAIIDDSGGNGKPSGKVLDLDGDGDYVVLANGTNFDFTDALTVAVWVKITQWGSGDDENYEAIVVKGGGSWMVQRFMKTDYIEFSCDNATHIRDWPDDDPVTPSTIPINDGKWHHIVAIHDGNGEADAKARLYVDGVLDAKAPFQADGDPFTTNARPVMIGENPGWAGHSFYGQMDDVRIYNRALSHDDVMELYQGSEGVATIVAPGKDATEVPRDVILSWGPGKFAATHDVYLGTSFADVNTAGRDNAMGVLVSESQDANTYDPPELLDWDQTYYWRVDEVNAAPDYTIYKGGVWSFTVEPFGYPIENVIATSNVGGGPENTVNGSGLNADDQHSIEAADMWLATAGADPVYIQYEFDVVYKLHEMLVWNYNSQFELVLGFGLKDVTVEYSENGVDWTLLGDVELAQATATVDYTANTAVDLQGVAARYVRLTVNSGYGVMGQLGLSEVRFLHIPVQASRPVPAVGAAEVSLDSVLSWRAGREAASHEIYLSTDEAAVVAGTALIDTVGDSTYAPADLQLGSTYYWKVNEVNDAGAIGSWEGSVWSFTTQEYVGIDDFESYDDEENLIYETWIDGWVNETGSTVGYLAEPFAERSIVNSGRQSMPLEYNNSAAPFYSEAERDLGGANWSAGGADTLRLYIRGNSDNAPAPLYVAVEDTGGQLASVTHADAQIALSTTWQQWLIPLGDFAGVNLSSIRTVYIGLGDRDNPSAGGTGLIFVDDIAVGHPASVR